jgi:tetratricopeptide (TPR) repeat protein
MMKGEFIRSGLALLALCILVAVPSCSSVSSAARDKNPVVKRPLFIKAATKKSSKTDAYYYFSIAQLMKKRGDLDGAIENYKLAIEKDPVSPLLYTDLGGYRTIPRPP